jgi:hypothetical protein
MEEPTLMGPCALAFKAVLGAKPEVFNHTNHTFPKFLIWNFFEKNLERLALV